MKFNNSFFYILKDEDEVVCETQASSIDKAIDYFKEIGYDLYSNKDLSIHLAREDFKKSIDDLRKDGDDTWDKWHPHY
jgi:hypothetical protein